EGMPQSRTCPDDAQPEAHRGLLVLDQLIEGRRDLARCRAGRRQSAGPTLDRARIGRAMVCVRRVARRVESGAVAEHLRIRYRIAVQPIAAVNAAGILPRGVEAREIRAAMLVDQHTSHEEMRFRRYD